VRPQNAASFGMAGQPRFQAPAQPAASAFSKPATTVHPSVIGNRNDRGLNKPFGENLYIVFKCYYYSNLSPCN